MTGYDGIDGVMAAARRATELEDDEHSPWYATATFELGHAHYVLGDLDAAMQVLAKAAYSASAYAVLRVFALGVMSMVAREQGNTAISRDTALEAMTIVDSHSLRHIPQASFAFTALGENEAEAGNLDGGIAILDEGLHLRRTAAGLNPWPTIHHLLAMGRVLTSAGDLQRAQHLLDEAGQLMSRYPGAMDAMRRRLAAARSTLRRRHTPDEPLQPLTSRELDSPAPPPRAGQPHRHRRRPLRLAQHRENPRPSHLPQARRHHPIRSRADRAPPITDLTPTLPPPARRGEDRGRKPV